MHERRALALVVAALALITGLTLTARPAGAAVSRTVKAVTTDGTLATTTPSVQQGSSITFSYSTTAAEENAKNWVGVYANPGNGPVNQKYVGPSTIYNYVGATLSGTTTFSTSSLGPGNYIAYYLYADGYTWLAQPVTFTVTAAPVSGTLSTTTSSVVQGDQITFAFSTTAAKENAKNWVGLYSNPGNGPVKQQYVGPSTTYNYVGAVLSGTTTFSTSSLGPGNYIAYYLYADGYTWLAQPVTFSVTKAVPGTPATYSAQWGQGQLAQPAAVAVDPAGDVWVADRGDNHAAEYSVSGTRLASFPTAPCAQPTVAGVQQPTGPQAIAATASDVFVADRCNNAVEEYTFGGSLVRSIGTAGSGNAQFNDPEGVAVDPQGNLWVADTDNNRVQKFTVATGAYVSSITGLAAPQGLGTDSAGDLWIADNGNPYNDAVLEYSPTGTKLVTLGVSGNTNQGGVVDPSDVVPDNAGHVYVTEPDLDLVQEFTTGGRYLDEFGDPSAGSGLLSFPTGVAVAGNTIYVADTGNDRVAVYAPSDGPSAALAEVPLAVGLPLAVVVVATGIVIVRRRSARRRATTEEAL